jgi:hypothetical protein
MSPTTTDKDAPREVLTLEDVKLRAERVRDLATVQAKQTVKDVAAQPMARTATVVAVALAAGLSLAYFFGSRAGARRAARRASRTAPPPV